MKNDNGFVEHTKVEGIVKKRKKVDSIDDRRTVSNRVMIE